MLFFALHLEPTTATQAAVVALPQHMPTDFDAVLQHDDPVLQEVLPFWKTAWLSGTETVVPSCIGTYGTGWWDGMVFFIGRSFALMGQSQFFSCCCWLL